MQKPGLVQGNDLLHRVQSNPLLGAPQLQHEKPLGCLGALLKTSFGRPWSTTELQSQKIFKNVFNYWNERSVLPPGSARTLPSLWGCLVKPQAPSSQHGASCFGQGIFFLMEFAPVQSVGGSAPPGRPCLSPPSQHLQLQHLQPSRTSPLLS